MALGSLGLPCVCDVTVPGEVTWPTLSQVALWWPPLLAVSPRGEPSAHPQEPRRRLLS